MRKLIGNLLHLVPREQYEYLMKEHKALLNEVKLTNQSIEVLVGQAEWRDLKARYRMRAH